MGARVGRAGGGFVLRVVLLALTCALASVMVALLALPLVGAIGAVTKSAADGFLDNNADLPPISLDQTTTFYDRTGKKFAELHGDQNRVIVSINDVPKDMQEAIIGIEDSRFYEHHGIDFEGVARALVRNNQGDSTQGASTLTQQYVKNVLLFSAHTKAEQAAATAQTFDRKIREARYALQLERDESKSQILEGYLNITNFGDGSYGVGAAAQHYFGIRVQSLNLAQSALLAGIVNSPTAYDPFLHPVAARKRRDTVLARMLSLGYITAAQEKRAMGVAMPVPHAAKAPADACEAVPQYGFFCDYVRNTMINDPMLGADQASRNHAVFDGGLRVRTTLDPFVQAAAQAAVDNVMPKTSNVLAVLAVVEPGTGKVLAIAANRDYSSSKAIGTTKVGIGYVPLGFNPGSTFKMFTLVTALEQQLPISTSFYSPPCYTSKIFGNPQPKDCYSNAGDSEAGTFDLASGTWFSVNTFFIQLEEKVGLDAVKTTATDFGIPKQRIADAGGSMTLGGLSDGVTPIELATAYATLAAHGVECDPHPISTVSDSLDKPVDVTQAAKCHRVVDASVADTATGILEGVLTQPGATAQGKGLAGGRVAAGKTGTTDGESSAWFAGFTPQLAIAVGMGDPLAPSAPLGTVQGVNPVFGGTLPATIWNEAMNGALVNKPALAMPPAIGAVVDSLGPSASGPPVTATASASASPTFVLPSGLEIFPTGTIPGLGGLGGSDSPSGSASAGASAGATATPSRGAGASASGGTSPPAQPTGRASTQPTAQPTAHPTTAPTTRAGASSAPPSTAPTHTTAPPPSKPAATLAPTPHK